MSNFMHGFFHKPLLEYVAMSGKPQLLAYREMVSGVHRRIHALIQSKFLPSAFALV